MKYYEMGLKLCGNDHTEILFLNIYKYFPKSNGNCLCDSLAAAEYYL